MENSTIKHFLMIMANTITRMETATQDFKSALLVLMGYFNENDLNTVIQEVYEKSPTSYMGNGYQEIVSNTPTTHTKTVEEIIREVQEMIIELKIKGSVREHRDGLIKFTSTVFGCVYGRTKEEIEKKLKEKIKQFKKKPQKDKKAKVSPLLSEFYRSEYLPYKRRQGRAESTLAEYDSEMRFIIKMKFDKPLNLYKSKEIEDFLYSFPEPRKRQMIQGLLNNIFNRALTLALIRSNPCAPIDRAQHTQEQGKAYSFNELKEFIQLLFDNKHLSYNDKCYFIFCSLVGTRRNEALGITVEDVDFKNKVLHIQGTKTKGSNRNIPLTPLVEKLLLSLKVKKGNYFKITQAMTNHYFREVWKKEKGHKLHDLRHTFGTIQICVNRIDVKTVSLWMGHSNIETTLRTYTHPEQLDKGTFYRGDWSENEKLTVYKREYDEILHIIEQFIG